MKLAAAEREAAKVPGLQAEIEKLKQELQERDQRIQELSEELKRLKVRPTAKAEVKQEVKREVKVPEEKKAWEAAAFSFCEGEEEGEAQSGACRCGKGVRKRS